MLTRLSHFMALCGQIRVRTDLRGLRINSVSYNTIVSENISGITLFRTHLTTLVLGYLSLYKLRWVAILIYGFGTYLLHIQQVVIDGYSVGTNRIEYRKASG